MTKRVIFLMVVSFLALVQFTCSLSPVNNSHANDVVKPSTPKIGSNRTLEITTITEESEMAETFTITSTGMWNIAQTMLIECSNRFEWNISMDSKELPTWLNPKGLTFMNDDPMLKDFFTVNYMNPAYYYIHQSMADAWGVGETPIPTIINYKPVSPLGQYTLDMAIRILELHPEFIKAPPKQGASSWWPVIEIHISRNNGKNNTPFWFLEKYYSAEGGSNSEDESTVCLPYVLFFQNYFPIEDGPTTLIDGYLFYEIGGSDHFKLDGKLKEEYIVFPPAP